MNCFDIIYIGYFRIPNIDAAANRVIANAKIINSLNLNVLLISGSNYFNSKKVFRYNKFACIATNQLDDNTNLLKKIFKILFVNFFLNLNTIFIIIKKKPKYVILYNPNLTNSILHLLTRAFLKYTLISDLTEWYSCKDFKYNYINPKFYANYINLKFVQKLIHNKILISSNFDTYYKSNNIILPPLVDILDDKWNNKKGINTFDVVKIIYAGNPGKKDNIEIVLDSIIEVNNISRKKIIITLYGINEYYKSYLIKKYSNKLNININNNIQSNLLPSIINTYHFCCFIRECNRKNNFGFPSKVVESLASSTPIITNLTSDLEKYLVNSENSIIVKHFQKEDIVESLLKVTILNDEEIAIMKKKSYSTAESIFHYQKWQNKMSYFLNNTK